MEKVKILLVTPELHPFSSNTGFAYVLNNLAKGFCELGHDVRIVIPKYQNSVQEFNTLVDFPVQIDWNRATAIIRESYIECGQEKIPVYLVDNYQYFDRETPYNHYDEAERFAFFCRSVLEMLPKVGFKPDVIHCNDWETGPISIMLKEQYMENDFYKNMKLIFTIHNMQYQGNYPKEILKLFNLDESYYNPDKLEFYGNVSFMKSGLIYSDIITTFSRTYATKLQTSDFGERMEGVLQLRREDFYGIINGVDYNVFNPETDSNIFCNYNKENLEEKKNNKYHLQSELGLPTKDVPVLAIVTKFQKDRGFDLLEEILDEIMMNDVQLIFLGKGDVAYENMLIRAKGKYTDKIGLWIGDNQDLEHRIYAGSDIFLSPSKFEIMPYRHMVAMRYGTVPVVRANGDVDDIVKSYNFSKNVGNGFVFYEY
jgi:starch synthase